MILNKLYEKKLIHPPKWLLTNTVYLTIMGSQAYGVANDGSDNDVYGIAVPPKEDVFPHLKGDIAGFGRQKQGFEQYQQHHIIDPYTDKNYDITVYNIIKYFTLAMENNPNIIDSLCVPVNCILHSTSIGNLIRDNRRVFFHKGCWARFKGYAYSQQAKINNSVLDEKNPVLFFEKMIGIDNKIRLIDIENFMKGVCSDWVSNELSKILTYKPPTPIKSKRSILDKIIAFFNKTDLQIEPEKIILKPTINDYYDLYKKELDKSGRFEMIKVNGWDIKFGYHTLRLLDEVEQILTTGDLDLQRAKEQMKSIRRGEWTIERLQEYFTVKEKELEGVYAASKLPWGPDETAIKKLLLQALEIHYGSLDKCVTTGYNVGADLTLIEEAVSRIRNGVSV